LTALIADQLLSLGLPQAAAELSANAIAYCRSAEQRAGQLLRLSRARRLLHDWDGVIECLTERKALLAPEGGEPPYSEAETTLFEARWWRNLDKHVLAPGIERVIDPAAPILHRLQMAVVALIVAGNFTRRNASRRLASLVESLVATTPREHYEKTAARLIHHTGFGDIQVALESGQELVRLSRRQNSLAALLRALRWASVPTKLAGDVDGSVSLLTEAYNHAVRLGLDAEAWNAVKYLGCVAVDVEDRTLARKWFHVFDEHCVTEASDAVRALASAYYCARLALMDRNFALAVGYATCARSHANRITATPQMSLSLTALEVALQMETSENEVSNRTLRQLLRLHRITSSTLQDFEVGVLATALLRANRPIDAERLYPGYVTARRSDLPLHPRLVMAQKLLATKP
jgi:hypothetical protein